ncbi:MULTISPECIES: biopolymer transporter ExbD [Paraburkholderia]|uniref:ExbD/TolR family protein n=1 Tax=Paraburkholderia TaxID=1822464 RepID=UPI0022514686|nr:MULTISPECIES: biopolymer transporter ExbD [Paraburkholderia]MCX4160473.1 biopolymer transporter ExbD [Paraburkholderia megapolitana]MDN7155971.1 biopolymer transporter ExbD [Paraburkholderia sp. CHISQ3]MDQ6493015.1 biopolymer transporter ExbD [Paraburkholderia megapolitana]
MKLRRTRASKRGRIEIIPMIDVMFFLLATFMLTSLAMQRLDAVRVDLPQGRAQQMSADGPLTLAVTRTNQIYINRQPVRLDQVTQAVAKLLQRDGNVIVAADDAASHGIVVQAMLAARQAGAEHFLVAVHRE